jgi:hypothetical protein
MHCSKTSGRAFPVVSFVYLPVECPLYKKAFAAVDDIAHAFKHVKVGNPASPDLRAKEVVSMPAAFDIATFDAGAFDVGSVTLESDSTVNVLAVVKEAAAFVRRQLIRRR